MRCKNINQILMMVIRYWVPVNWCFRNGICYLYGSGVYLPGQPGINPTNNFKTIAKFAPSKDSAYEEIYPVVIFWYCR
jgi:hypothetical protein